MRALHVVPTYVPAWRYGGPIRSVHGLCRALAAAGVEVDVATTSVDGPGDSDVPHDRRVDVDGVGVRYFRSRRLRRLYYSETLARHLERVVPGYDVVHVHAVFLWPGLHAARVARRHAVPFALSPRGMLVADLIRMQRRLVKTLWIYAFECRTLADAAVVMASTPHERDEIERLGLAAGRVEIHPNGVDALPPPGPERRGERPLFLGRISPEKGLDRLVGALASMPDVSIDVAGNDEAGYGRRLERLAASLGVDGRLRFLGPLDGAAKWDALAAAPLVILPSYSENFGIAALEAMAAGTPVALTREVGLADTVARHGGGWVVPGEPARMAEVLRGILADRVRLAEEGARARRIIEARFTWERIAEGVRESYERIR